MNDDQDVEYHLIPESVREIYRLLEQDVVWLHARWRMYVELFGTNRARFDLMNESASDFFYQLNHILLDSIVVEISRLTDKANSRGKNALENLTLAQLVEKLDQNNFPELTKDLTLRLQSMDLALGPLRKRRHKRIAHRDLSTAMEEAGTSSVGVSRLQIKMALKEIDSFMNTFSIFFLNSVMHFEGMELLTGANALLDALMLATECKARIAQDPNLRIQMGTSARWAAIWHNRD